MTKSLPAHDLSAALDSYVHATAHALRVTVERQAFAEPSAPYDPVHALWVLERYIESISGFALGIVAASIARASRAWLGDDDDRAVVAALADLAERGMPGANNDVVVSAWFERDSSLVDVLAPWLHARICGLGREVRALANAVEAAIPEERTRALAVMFHHLATDTLVAERFGYELGAGWTSVLAVLTGMRDTNASPLWQEWSRRVCGDAPPPVEPAPGEYIAVIR